MAYSFKNNQTSFKVVLGGVLALLSISSYALDNKVNEAINPELAFLKKEHCLVNKKAIKHYFSNDGMSLLLRIPYEGCNGSNNWGAVTKIYWGYENGSWKKSKTVNTTGFNSVKNKDKDSFIVTSTEYAPDDAHCCPSINKKFLVSPN